jgi:hypothetical protein
VVYRTIKESLGQVRDLGELDRRLRSEGIEMRYRLGESGQRVGVSFFYQNEAFRGSEIDRGFSLRGLERAVGQRLELSQWEEEKLVQGKLLRQEEERVLKEQEIAREQGIAREQEALRQKEAMKLEESLKLQETLKQEKALKQKQALKQTELLTQKETLKEVQRQRHTPRLRIH